MLAAGCGDGEQEAGLGHGAHAHPADEPPGKPTSGRFAGFVAKPRKPAPRLVLRDSFGRRVDLDRFRGSAVIVTFVYVNCPDVCPLIVRNLAIARSRLGPAAEKLRILAVSVDPDGDTRTNVNAFLRRHRMTRRMRYLVGSRPELERVWHEWSVLSNRSPARSNPDFVELSAPVYGISASGRITTLYSTSFEPAQIVHDVPLLAAQ